MTQRVLVTDTLADSGLAILRAEEPRSSATGRSLSPRCFSCVSSNSASMGAARFAPPVFTSA